MSQEICERVRTAIEAAIAGARAEVDGGGGHYRVTVVSSAFDGKTTLQRHRMVLAAIAPMMAGDAAPVHAVDSIDARTA